MRLNISSLALYICLSVYIGGCSSALTPELIAALAQDNASFCATSDIRGGAGGIIGGATGGYGSATLAFCRSNHDGATLSIKPDGTVSIEHK